MGAGGGAPAESTPCGPGPRRAERLAAALGGRVQESAAGPSVVVDWSCRLPLDTERLARLPYPIDLARPLVCLDTETTGLGTGTGTLPFLVGMGSWQEDEFRVRQFVLPDHPDEPALLAALARELPPQPWLVTYNGRAFDWPLIAARYRLQHQPPPVLAGHLDLLPVARQLWKHRLSDARLASVEAGVIGVRRLDDLPGALIPARYFHYLHTGQGRLLARIIEHNRQDIVSLARLLVELTQRLLRSDAPLGVHPGDLAGLGRAYARRRQHEEALRCAEQGLAVARGAVSRAPPDPLGAARGRLVERLLMDRARALARTGRREEARAVWEELAEQGGFLSVLAWVQVAKHREHLGGDLSGALLAAERALALLHRARLLGRPRPLWERDLERRLPRLRRKLAAEGRLGAKARAAPGQGAGIGHTREAHTLHREAAGHGRETEGESGRQRQLAEWAAAQQRREPGSEEGVTRTRLVALDASRHRGEATDPEAPLPPHEMQGAAFARRDRQLLSHPGQQLDECSTTRPKVLATHDRHVRAAEER